MPPNVGQTTERYGSQAPPVGVISIDPTESLIVGVFTIKVADVSTPTGEGSVIVI